jgi:hypothetical protein
MMTMMAMVISCVVVCVCAVVSNTQAARMMITMKKEQGAERTLGQRARQTTAAGGVV